MLRNYIKPVKEDIKLITINHLVKKYNQHVAVDDLTFQVEKGQIYGFLGPNGAGKSTTMNILTGYLAATSGEVLINGHDIMKEPEEAKKCIGYLPELPPLYQEMTVLEYLKFVAELKLIKKSDRAKQINEVMKLTKVEDVKDRLIHNLSKGYKQRVGLAQAILGYPEIIVLDEPTVGLDPKQIIEIRDLIKELGKKHTIILSSHILSEVSAICDKIMIISKGKLVACDTAEALIKLLNGSSETEVVVRGSKEKIEEVIKNLKAVKKYRFETMKEAGLYKVFIETPTDVDIREELFTALAENKLLMMELKLNEKTLEDIFLELTDDKPSENSDKKKTKLFQKKDKTENMKNDKKANEEVIKENISKESEVSETEEAATKEAASETEAK